MSRTYLIYEILDDNDDPIYVGQTCNIRRRMQEHRDSVDSKSTFLYKKLFKLKSTGYRLKYSILEDGLSLEEANRAEMRWISFYGRRDLGLGPLTNLTDGGEGSLRKKVIFTEDWKNKLSEAAKRRYAKDPDHVILASHKARNPTSDSKRLKSFKKTLQEKYSGHSANYSKRLNLTLLQREKISIRAVKTFTGKKQSADHISKRAEACRETKLKNAKKVVVTVDGVTEKLTGPARSISDLLLNKYGIDIKPPVIQNMLKESDCHERIRNNKKVRIEFSER